MPQDILRQFDEPGKVVDLSSRRFDASKKAEFQMVVATMNSILASTDLICRCLVQEGADVTYAIVFQAASALAARTRAVLQTLGSSDAPENDQYEFASRSAAVLRAEVAALMAQIEKAD